MTETLESGPVDDSSSAKHARSLRELIESCCTTIQEEVDHEFAGPMMLIGYIREYCREKSAKAILRGKDKWLKSQDENTRRMLDSWFVPQKQDLP